MVRYDYPKMHIIINNVQNYKMIREKTIFYFRFLIK
jgi:hypothetical protein